MRNDNYRNDDNRRPEEIESDIERTRAEVSSTIDAIQSKLTPGQMMDQAVAYARTSLPADFGTNLGNAVRDNPLPVALIGVGLAWLMASGRNADGQARLRREASHYDDYAETGAGVDQGQQGTMQRAAGKLSETGRGLKDKTSELGHQISDRTSAVTGRAREMTGRAREMGHGARERLGAIGERSQQGYYRTRDSLSHMVEEQPLVLGALGLAVGTLLGAMLPGTRREDEMMGEKRDQLVGRAKDTLREQAASAKDTVQHAIDERTREAGKTDGAAMQPAGGTSAAPPPPTQAGEQHIGSTSSIGGVEKSPYGPH
ncbi:MAG TPA: DUF3618 domain-containing protein [Noviherbaspirillum sp.]|nr:DUF3618 domain-containing protein [Noviherbaspirillum sp.]